MAETDKRTYEAMFLFGTAAVANLDKTLDRVKTIVEGAGGTPVVLRKFDERRLAYEIRKQKRGLYVLCYYEGPPGSVAAIAREVRLTDDVLRHLVIGADHLSEQEMNDVQPQKYEPIELDPERRPRRLRPEGEQGEQPSADEGGAEGTTSARPADAVPAGA